MQDFQFSWDVYKRFHLGTPGYLSLADFLIFACFTTIQENTFGKLFPLDMLIGWHLVSQYYKNKSQTSLRFVLLKLPFPRWENPWAMSNFGQVCSFNVEECSYVRDGDALIGLQLRCDRFFCFPYEEINNNDGNAYTLTAYRPSDPKAPPKEIQQYYFCSGCRTITVRDLVVYVQKYCVLPWWHPEFSHF